MTEQVLDSMDLERERGITIKAQSVALQYEARDGKTYQLNFIDTPGHVDFAYEVSRSLAACEGALLVVDAAQGVEAQTLANCYTALEQGLEVIPVLNKIDLAQAEPDRVVLEIEEIIGIEAKNALRVSAKTGQGVVEVLEQIIEKISPPKGKSEADLQALIIDSWFDNYLGIVSLVRVVEGTIQKEDKIQIFSTQCDYIVSEVGIFTPKKKPIDRLVAGQVGYVVAGIKTIGGAPVGDTILHTKGSKKPLPGFKRVKPLVYAGLFPLHAEAYESFREALAKLQLNDAALQYEPESSPALGFGFRCGFLGLLHMEIVKERLEREYHLELLITAPNVVYEVNLKNHKTVRVDNPARFPPPGEIVEVHEPLAEARILVAQRYVGDVMSLAVSRRGVQKKMQFVAGQVMLTYVLPMAEVVMDFFDRLKSVSRGYASLDYDFTGYQKADLVKLDILVNGEKVDALSIITHRASAYHRGRALVLKLKEVIPRQLFEVAIQAAIGVHVIARETVKALRKNVLAKCYGGDVTRKRKLLEKQKEGKKRMKQIGTVSIPQEAFLAILQVDKK